MEVKTKHTPGPWAVENLVSELPPTDVVLGYPTPELGNPVPICMCDCDAVGIEEAAANARLIAAAPDLLAALKEIVMLASIGQWYNEDLARDKIGTAKAAIAKANGEGE